VVVGVEVKETSHESACWRFSRNANEINLPSDGTPLYGRFLLNVQQSAKASRRRLRGHRAPIHDGERGTRWQKNLLTCS
jgi:hypothetical protein